MVAAAVAVMALTAAGCSFVIIIQQVFFQGLQDRYLTAGPARGFGRGY
ncbi:hypothetical protein ACXO8K_03205 [Lactobacillus delbrueckii subsp. bulgaricus]